MSPDMEPRITDVYGPGTYADRVFVPVPRDTARIFRLLASQTPGFTQDEALLSKVRFVGEDYLVLPGPIKSVSVAAALHAMAGVVGDEILSLRGRDNTNRQIIINTTHTAFFLGSVALGYLGGQTFSSLGQQQKLRPLLPDWEKGWHSTPLRKRGTGIYPTRTPGVWYSLHGSLDMPAMLSSIGIDADEPEITTQDLAAAHITKTTTKYSPEELEMHNLIHSFCGSICFTPAQWAASSMGKSLAAHPLINVQPQLEPHTILPTLPTPFPRFHPSDTRPLAGIKIIELSRVIAGPEIGAILASFGADVIRVSAPHLRDINAVQLTLNAGKRTVALDLRQPADHAYLHALLRDADVFIQGFRPGSLAKHGLDLPSLLSMAGRRGKGIVVVSESCYGPDGLYASRPGWQQIADCASGAAYVMGRGMDLPDGECVLPALPISDMSTGVVATVGTMLALRDRAVKGGSYAVDAALVAVNRYALSEEVGLYGRETVAACQKRFAWGEMRAAHHVLDLMGTVWRGWSGDAVLGGYLAEDSGWFQSWEGSAFRGLRLSVLRPVVRFVDGEGGGEESGVTPEWRSPSVPHGWERKEDVAFRDVKEGRGWGIWDRCLAGFLHVLGWVRLGGRRVNSP